MGPRVQSLLRRQRPAALAVTKPLLRATLGRQVFDHLRSLLIGGRLAPGERLSLRAIAEPLGVSMMPVREAVSRLVADGALEVLPNRAVRVPVMTLAQFRELTRLRVLIEGFAAAEAAVTITPRQLEALCVHEQAFRRESAGTQPNPARAVEENRRLHFALYTATGMPQLLAVIEGLWLRAGPVLNLDMREEPRRLKRGTAVRCHAALVQALRRRDPEAAREAVVADISAAAQHIAELGQLAVDTVGADSKGTDDGSGDRGPARAGHRRR
jgi:DNA-binding GntR family transcriptional regulator